MQEALDSTDPTMLAAAAGVTGVALIASVACLCSAKTAEPKSPPEKSATKARAAPKKKSSKGKKKSAKPTPAAAPAAAVAAPAPAAAAADAGATAAAQPSPPPVAEESETPPSSAPKKKKNKRKAKAAAAAESPPAAPALVSEGSSSSQTTAAAAAQAADTPQPDLEEEPGWIEVPKSRMATKRALMAAEAGGAEKGSGGGGGDGGGAHSTNPGGADGTSGDAVDAAAAAVPSLDVGDFLAQVIGKKGSTIKRIEEESKAKLRILPDTTICTITGGEEEVEAARAMVQAIIDREQSIRDNTVSLTMDVGDKKIPAVIGKKGANIKKIAELSGADLKVQRPENLVLITGEAEQVAKAKDLVDLYCNGGPPPEAREEVELGSERGRYVVLGKQGSTIRAIQDETGAKLELEKGQTFVTVEGDADQVAMAVAQLNALLEENAFAVTVPSNGHVPAIIGKGGVTIRSIRETTGAAVDLMGDDVKLTGTQQQVLAAKKIVEKLIAEDSLPPWAKLSKGEVCEELPLGDAVGMIIGRGGLQIRAIKESTGAKLDISREVHEAGLCRIFGSSAAVAKAKAEVQELLTKHSEMMERKAKYEAAQAERKARAAAAVSAAAADKGDEGQDEEAAGGAGDGAAAAGDEEWSALAVGEGSGVAAGGW